jgi:hypothetical protein
MPVLDLGSFNTFCLSARGLPWLTIKLTLYYINKLDLNHNIQPQIKKSTRPKKALLLKSFCI